MSAPKRRVVLTDDARDDLESIALFGLPVWGEAAVDAYHSEIAEVLSSLVRFPRMGHRTDELPAGVFAFSVAQHVIYYRFDNDAIYVLRIVHNRMDSAGHLGTR